MSSRAVQDIRTSAFFPVRKATPSNSGDLGSDAAAEQLPRVSTLSEHTPARQTETQQKGFCRRWKFPSSKRHLWDRTPAAQACLVEAGEFLPMLQAFHQNEAACRDYAMQSLGVTFQWRLPYQQLGVMVEGMTYAPINLSSAEEVQACSSRLAHQLLASCHLRGQIPAGQMLKASLGHWGQSQTARLEGVAVAPGVGLIITPLLSKRICPVPLALHLSQTSAAAQSFPCHLTSGSNAQHQSQPACQSGILTLDQARNLLPIRGDDPKAYLVPSVGIWLSGVPGPADPFVRAAAISFICTSQLQERILLPDNAFLLLLYCPGSSTPRSFECKLSGIEAGIPFHTYRWSMAKPSPGQSSSCRLEALQKSFCPIVCHSLHSAELGADTPAPRLGPPPTPHASPAAHRGRRHPVLTPSKVSSGGAQIDPGLCSLRASAEDAFPGYPLPHDMNTTQPQPAQPLPHVQISTGIPCQPSLREISEAACQEMPHAQPVSGSTWQPRSAPQIVQPLPGLLTGQNLSEPAEASHHGEHRAELLCRHYGQQQPQNSTGSCPPAQPATSALHQSVYDNASASFVPAPVEIKRDLSNRLHRQHDELAGCSDSPIQTTNAEQNGGHNQAPSPEATSAAPLHSLSQLHAQPGSVNQLEPTSQPCQVGAVHEDRPAKAHAALGQESIQTSAAAAWQPGCTQTGVAAAGDGSEGSAVAVLQQEVSNLRMQDIWATLLQPALSLELSRSPTRSMNGCKSRSRNILQALVLSSLRYLQRQARHVNGPALLSPSRSSSSMTIDQAIFLRNVSSRAMLQHDANQAPVIEDPSQTSLPLGGVQSVVDTAPDGHMAPMSGTGMAASASPCSSPDQLPCCLPHEVHIPGSAGRPAAARGSSQATGLPEGLQPVPRLVWMYEQLQQRRSMSTAHHAGLPSSAGESPGNSHNCHNLQHMGVHGDGEQEQVGLDICLACKTGEVSRLPGPSSEGECASEAKTHHANDNSTASHGPSGDDGPTQHHPGVHVQGSAFDELSPSGMHAPPDSSAELPQLPLDGSGALHARDAGDNASPEANDTQRGPPQNPPEPGMNSQHADASCSLQHQQNKNDTLDLVQRSHQGRHALHQANLQPGRHGSPAHVSDFHALRFPQTLARLLSFQQHGQGLQESLEAGAKSAEQALPDEYAGPVSAHMHAPDKLSDDMLIQQPDKAACSGAFLGSKWRTLPTHGWQASSSLIHQSSQADGHPCKIQPQLHSDGSDRQDLPGGQAPAESWYKGKGASADSTAVTMSDQLTFPPSECIASSSQTSTSQSPSAGLLQEQIPTAQDHGATMYSNGSAGPLQPCWPPQAVHHLHQVSTPTPKKGFPGSAFYASTALAAAAGLRKLEVYAEADENADPMILAGDIATFSGGAPRVSFGNRISSAARMDAWRQHQASRESVSEASSDEDLAAHEDPECPGMAMLARITPDAIYDKVHRTCSLAGSMDVRPIPGPSTHLPLPSSALLPPSLRPLSRAALKGTAALNVVRTQCLPLSDSEESDDEEDARLEEKYGLLNK
ncbi:hypothetical protein WJX74_003183 [Apatococcus lobatus]|uniref:STIL N-terminal domain-containing protein n=1 Tax=Apatococcus lobatus TaxID=904363 RepID=A0AAW1R0Y8_9CHLO